MKVKRYVVHYTLEHNGVERSYTKDVYAPDPNTAEDELVRVKVCNHADVDYVEEL